MATVNRLARRLRKSQRGAAIVEFALVTPIFLLIFAGMGDFALLFRSYQVATNAAREGARIAVLPGYEGGGYSVPEARAVTYMTTVLGAMPSGCTTCGAVATDTTVSLGGTLPAATAVQMVVTYRYDFKYIGRVIGMLSGTWRSDITFSVVSTMRKESQGV